MKKQPVYLFFIDWISSPYHIELVAGLEEAAAKKGISLITAVGGALNSPKSYEKGSNFLYDLLGPLEPEGIIIESGFIGQYITKEELLEFRNRYKDIPFVSLSEVLETVPSVTIENAPGLKKMVQHLIDVHGYKKIAFISGPEDNSDAIERLSAYKEALESRGISYDENLVLPGHFVNKSGKEAVKVLLDERKIMPQAIVAANDDMALGALEALTERGISVPGKIALAGFDDQTDSRCCASPLTTVRRPIARLGDKAVSLLVEMNSGFEPQPWSRLPAEMVLRASCGCSPAGQTSCKEDKEADSLFPFMPGKITEMMSLMDVFRNLGYTRNLKRLTDYINWAFPVIGVNSGFFALFNKHNPGMVGEVMTFDKNEGCRIPGDAHELSPEELFARRFAGGNMRLFSLTFDDVVIGVAGYEPARTPSVLSDTMRTSFLLNIFNSITIHYQIKERHK